MLSLLVSILCTVRFGLYYIVNNELLVPGGDVIAGDGSGAISIFGKSFKDENFNIKHTAPGFVSMANSGGAITNNPLIYILLVT